MDGRDVMSSELQLNRAKILFMRCSIITGVVAMKAIELMAAEVDEAVAVRASAVASRWGDDASGVRVATGVRVGRTVLGGVLRSSRRFRPVAGLADAETDDERLLVGRRRLVGVSVVDGNSAKDRVVVRVASGSLILRRDDRETHIVIESLFVVRVLWRWLIDGEVRFELLIVALPVREELQRHVIGAEYSGPRQQ